jgi:enoyl-CoA hydratase
MSRVADDPSVRAVVLTGAGTAFCAGLDLRELGKSGANLRLVGPAAGRPRPWRATTKPVIGAVNGPAVTAGLEIALTCDFLIASEQASFGDTHARVGVLPGWGLSYLLPQAVGVRRAREMSLTGRLVGAGRPWTGVW